ncbi:chymotrypsin-like elastase family member 2A [Ixodes scapularis]|uniref:chymotrypsin-like elastase family member 2A n=1 Tax=Ixodes scapularis TaxID=6945 RepID=UPI001A9FBDD4|nr:chymotrypsin-like elastase family member 2A [Ixodes scapularis]
MKANVLILIIFYLKHNSASSPRLTENCGLVTTTPDSVISERILNGTNATPGAWPWMVEIFDASGHRCGGALITSRHVLTNAHCLTHVFKKSIRVLLGSYSRQQAEKGLEEEIETICMYSQFVENIFETDIAIITLKRPVECSETIKTVCLPDINDNPDSNVPMYVAGWGFTEPIMWNNQSLSEDVDGSHGKEDLTTVNFGLEKESQEVTEDTTEYYDYYDPALAPVYPATNKFPDMLQEARVRLIPNEECDKLYNETSLHGNIVCAMHDFGSICSGDSGGPLVYKAKDGRWTLMGLITATEMPCNVTNLPMYFVRIKPFMDNFILPCVQNLSNCTCKAANNTESFIYI